MQVFTDSLNILFVTGSEDSPGNLFAGVKVSTSQIVWCGDTGELVRESPDCVLLSEQLETTQACEIARTLSDESLSVPVVAFIGDENTDVERLLDAGVTEVIRAATAEAEPALIRRRIETALSTIDRAVDASTGDETTNTVTERSDWPGYLLQDVTESINDVVWVNVLGDEGLEYVNSAYEEVWGRPREQLYEDRTALLETVHPVDRQRVREAMEKQLESPETYDVTYRVIRPDGEQRWVHSRTVGVRENGELVRIVGVATDITERKRHQEQLAAERDLVERILETSPVGITVIDSAGEIIRANDQAETILNVSETDLEGGLYSPDGVSVRDMEGNVLPEAEFPFNRIKKTGEPLWDEQYKIGPTGEGTEAETVIEVDGVPLFEDGSLERVVIVFEDVTEQVAREQRLEEQRDELVELNHINRIIRSVDKTLLGTQTRNETLQAVCDNLATTDRYEYCVALDFTGEKRLEAAAWTDEATDFVDEAFPVTGAASTAGPVTRALETGETQVIQQIETNTKLKDEWIARFQDADVRSFAAIPVIYEGSEYGVIVVFSTEKQIFGARNLSVLDELGETVGHAIAAAESREREQTLTSLYQATDDFLTAETPRDVSETAVNTAMDVLNLSGIGIFLFDDETNLLSPVAGTETFLDFFGESPVFGPGKEDSITWHTYVTGETHCFADVRESDRLAKPDTSARSSLLIPLGEHGVFVAASTEVGIFDDQKRHLVGLLAATTEAALDRVAGQADIRERDAELESQTRRLEELDNLLSVSQDVSKLVRDAKTRAELEQGLCNQLVTYDCLSFAWVGHHPGDHDKLVPRAWAGSEDGYLDDISLRVDGDEPALRTAATDETVTIPNVTTQIRENEWAQKALDREFQSILAVPLSYGDTDYGVVAVYATDPGTFNPSTETSIDELGSAIAYGINSVETRRGILSERVTELDITLGTTDTLLNAVASIAGEPVSYQEMTPMDDQTTQTLFTLSDPPVAEILELESEFVVVDSLTHTKQGGNHLFRATISGQTVATDLLQCGGIPEQIIAGPEKTRATVTLSAELSVREFLERVSEQYPEAELRSREHTENLDTATSTFQQTLEERLTDRQREVLITAYESGYFQSPRETTGEELAELLDISQPTVTHHLREAQYRLFTAIFEQE